MPFIFLSDLILVATVCKTNIKNIGWKKATFSNSHNNLPEGHYLKLYAIII